MSEDALAPDHSGDRRARRRASTGRSRRSSTSAPRITFAAARRRGGHVGARADRVGHRARRPGRDLGAEHHRVGARRARRLRRGRGARPAQHPLQGRRGRVHPRPGPGASCCSPSPTSSTPTTSSSCARPSRSQSLEQIVVLRGAPAAGHARLGRLPRPGRRDARVRGRGPQRRARPATRSPTSSSRRAPPAGPKGAMLTHGASVAGVRRVVDRGRPARRRPLPRRQPVLPRVRAEGRHPRLPDQGRDDRPARGVRRRPR